MKVFLGLTPGKALLEAVNAWREKHKNLPVRWLRDEDLHITLIPPWPEDNIKYTKNLLPQVGPVPQFDMQFDRVELGPRPDRRSLIWAVGEATPGLLEFKYKTESVFEKPHNPRFLLHVTLARFDNPAFQFSPQNVSWKGGAESTVLFESLGNSKYGRLGQI